MSARYRGKPGYSAAHYRLINPPADTPKDIAERLRYRTCCEQMRAELHVLYPTITDANATEVLAWQDARIRELIACQTHEG